LLASLPANRAATRPGYYRTGITAVFTTYPNAEPHHAVPVILRQGQGHFDPRWSTEHLHQRAPARMLRRAPMPYPVHPRCAWLCHRRPRARVATYATKACNPPQHSTWPHARQRATQLAGARGHLVRDSLHILAAHATHAPHPLPPGGRSANTPHPRVRSRARGGRPNLQAKCVRSPAELGAAQPSSQAAPPATSPAPYASRPAAHLHVQCCRAPAAITTSSAGSAHPGRTSRCAPAARCQ
jgi:hypothetical protein